MRDTIAHTLQVDFDLCTKGGTALACTGWMQPMTTAITVERMGGDSRSFKDLKA